MFSINRILLSALLGTIIIGGHSSVIKASASSAAAAVVNEKAKVDQQTSKAAASKKVLKLLPALLLSLLFVVNQSYAIKACEPAANRASSSFSSSAAAAAVASAARKKEQANQQTAHSSATIKFLKLQKIPFEKEKDENKILVPYVTRQQGDQAVLKYIGAQKPMGKRIFFESSCITPCFKFREMKGLIAGLLPYQVNVTADFYDIIHDYEYFDLKKWVALARQQGMTDEEMITIAGRCNCCEQLSALEKTLKELDAQK